jgi:hypothetical protein
MEEVLQMLLGYQQKRKPQLPVVIELLFEHQITETKVAANKLGHRDLMEPT